ncbi:hypothetical protein C5B42_00320 [Candidatus Cerribacteria bacterium 'Amazon FNV 2010 28 9']|uniref:N-acetylglucosaminyltransferase n=1 Tax=Candidatus Cerribacteria bacterium 'Amazon FNV 2010 28 9' TaxID=2081795 RepID=A0A317JQN2_9BACT|nr:MAG: hypothetical protein C5B42_00320 [Candidatus Cerribacteria bacterium 'Amazon FNV 2010 28 9']
MFPLFVVWQFKIYERNNMIYDCFNFYNEFELLELRLQELWDVVDYFVIAEATVTFTNRPKPLYFKEQKKRFKKYAKKIIHVVIDDCPNVCQPWIIENWQFTQVIRGLKKAKPNDTILVGCVDELPSKEKILEYKDKKGKHKAFMQEMSFYYLNFVSFGKESPWPGTRMFRYKDLLTYPYNSPYIARFTPVDVEIADGGWHIRFTGGVKAIQEKLTAWSHQEFNNDRFNTPEDITLAMRRGEDFLHTGLTFQFIDHPKLPQTIANDPEKYANWFLQSSQSVVPLEAVSLRLQQRLRIIVRTLLAPFRY